MSDAEIGTAHAGLASRGRTGPTNRSTASSPTSAPAHRQSIRWLVLAMRPSNRYLCDWNARIFTVGRCRIYTGDQRIIKAPTDSSLNHAFEADYPSAFVAW